MPVNSSCCDVCAPWGQTQGSSPGGPTGCSTPAAEVVIGTTPVCWWAATENGLFLLLMTRHLEYGVWGWRAHPWRGVVAQPRTPCVYSVLLEQDMGAAHSRRRESMTQARLPVFGRGERQFAPRVQRFRTRSHQWHSQLADPAGGTTLGNSLPGPGLQGRRTQFTRSPVDELKDCTKC